MRIGKLYVKIFLYFLGTLVVAELLMFGLFHWFIEDVEQRRGENFARAHLELMEIYVREHGPAAAAQELSRLHNTPIWFVDETGKLVAASSAEPVPEFPSYRVRRKGHAEYGFSADGRLHLRVELAGQAGGRLFVRAAVPFHRGGGGGSIAALLGLGLAFTLLIFPVSRLISRPVRELRDSALRIAEGDLEHRADIRRSDEIGELGRAFNLMAARVAAMVRGTRELTAHVSHELRSPLARMRVAEEMLRDQGPSGGTRQLDVIRREIEELDRLIGKILHLSKLDLQNGPGVGPLDAAPIFRDLLERYADAFRKRGIEVTGVIDADFPRIMADEEELRALLSALLENALKFTNEGGRFWYRLERSGLMALSNTCADEVPVEEARLDAFFEPFRRFADPRIAGDGLGLALARRLAERMGATLKARRLSSDLPGRPELEFVLAPRLAPASSLSR